MYAQLVEEGLSANGLSKNNREEVDKKDRIKQRHDGGYGMVATFYKQWAATIRNSIRN